MAQAPKEYYLIGFAKKQIEGPNPPTLRQLLQNAVYYQFELKESLNQSVKLTIQNAMDLWKKLKVPTKRIDHCAEKFRKEYSEWKLIYKNRKSRKTTENFRG